MDTYNKQDHKGFAFLRKREIISILDGDTSFGEINVPCGGNIPISMPYLSGPAICQISKDFGMRIEYDRSNTKSRWEYFDDLLLFCLAEETMEKLLRFLFSKGQFIQKLTRHTSDIIESAYKTIVDTVIKQINACLAFNEVELIKIGNNYSISSIRPTGSVYTPAIAIIDNDYIIDLTIRAMQDVDNENYDSAITKCRTLLEEVFIYVIEKQNATPIDNGDIGRLYNQVKDLYNMHQKAEIDKRINGLLSGLEKILNAITEMRNKGSDSHGVGSKRYRISAHHARLFVNSAMTMAEFILAVGNNKS